MLRLALRNVFRQRKRTAFALAAIVFGVAGLIVSGGFVYDMFDKLAEAIIHSQTGHVQLAKEGFFTGGARSPEKYLLSDAEALVRQLSALAHVKDAAARLHFSGLLGNGRATYPIVGEGIDADREARLGTRLVIKTGRMLSEADRLGALIGEGVSKALKVAPGDQISLLVNAAEGAMNTLEFEVVGVFQSFSKEYDARAVKIPLAAAQELLDSRGANLIVLSLDSTRATAATAAALRRDLAGAGIDVRAWNELNDFYPKTVELYDRQFGFLRLIILVMVLLSVVNGVNMTLFERIGEFGTMLALGDRTRKVFGMIVLEGAILGLVGAVLGVLVGVGIALAASRIGIPMPPPPNSNLPYTAEIRLVPAVLGGAFLTGLLATVAASLLPAFRASRIPVVDALRQNI